MQLDNTTKFSGVLFDLIWDDAIMTNSFAFQKCMAQSILYTKHKMVWPNLILILYILPMNLRSVFTDLILKICVGKAVLENAIMRLHDLIISIP